MRISVAADERTGVAEAVADELRRRGHEPLLHGALADGDREDWAWSSEAAAPATWPRAAPTRRSCAAGPGPARRSPPTRSAASARPCAQTPRLRGARKWNDANVLALSLRTTSAALLGEILDGWFEAAPSDDAGDRANVSHLDQIG